MEIERKKTQTLFHEIEVTDVFDFALDNYSAAPGPFMRIDMECTAICLSTGRRINSKADIPVYRLHAKLIVTEKT